MQHQPFRLGFAGEFFQGTDVVHTNIIRFVAAQLTDTGFQPFCESIASVIVEIAGKQVLHVVIALILFAKTIVIKLTLFGPGFCAIKVPGTRRHAYTFS